MNSWLSKMLSNYKYGKCVLVDGVLFNKIEIEPWTLKTRYYINGKVGPNQNRNDLMIDIIRLFIPGYSGSHIIGQEFTSNKRVGTGNDFPILDSYGSNCGEMKIFYLIYSPHVLVCMKYLQSGHRVYVLIPTVATKEEFERFLSRRFSGPFDLSLYYNTIPKHITPIDGVPVFLHVFIQDCTDFDLVRDMLPVYMSRCGVISYAINLDFISSVEKYLLMNELGINILRGGVIVRRSSINKTINITDTGSSFELM